MINSIFACDADGGIGKNGTLPWPHDPEDMKWFKTHTTDSVVVMGKKTWFDKAMPKPLPGRTCIVLARDKTDLFGPAHMILDGDNIYEAFHTIKTNYDKPIWVIGGAAILNVTRPLVSKVFVTRFDGTYDCDVKIDLDWYLNDFSLVEEKQAQNKRFQKYERISQPT